MNKYKNLTPYQIYILVPNVKTQLVGIERKKKTRASLLLEIILIQTTKQDSLRTILKEKYIYYTSENKKGTNI